MDIKPLVVDISLLMEIKRVVVDISRPEDIKTVMIIFWSNDVYF